MGSAIRYNLVLETTLKGGIIVRDTLHNVSDAAFASTLAVNLNASMEAAKRTGQIVAADSHVLVEPTGAQRGV